MQAQHTTHTKVNPMRYDNAFDRALESRKIKEPWRAAAVDVTDTLDLAWVAAKEIFDERAKPEHAIAIAELMLRAAWRQQQA